METLGADESAISSQQEDAGVRENAANRDDIVQVWTRHLYIPETNKRRYCIKDSLQWGDGIYFILFTNSGFTMR